MSDRETFTDCHGRVRRRNPLRTDLSDSEIAYLAGVLDAGGLVRWLTNGKQSTLRCRIEIPFRELELRSTLMARFGGYERRGSRADWRFYGRDAQRLLDITERFRLKTTPAPPAGKPEDRPATCRHCHSIDCICPEPDIEACRAPSPMGARSCSLDKGHGGDHFNSRGAGFSWERSAAARPADATETGE